MPSPGRRTSPPPQRISSRHSPPSGRRRSPERRRPGPPPRGGGSSSSKGHSRERRRSPPVHAPSKRQADNRSRPRRSRSPPPMRIRTPTPQRVRTPPPTVPLPRSFPPPVSGTTKRKLPPKEQQQERMPERRNENNSNRSGSRSLISPPRKMNRSRSPHPRQEIPVTGPVDDPVPRDYRSRSRSTYAVAMSPPGNKGRRMSPPLPLTDRFRNENTNVFKGVGGEFNLSEMRNTRIHVILNPQTIEHNEIDPAHLSVVRRPGEGSKPIFARDEILQAMHSPEKYESKYEPKYELHDHERIVIIESRPAVLQEGSRCASPRGRYESERFDVPSTSRDSRYNSNEDYRPTREYDRPASSYDQRESSRSERQGGDMRLPLEYRHDSSRYSVERERGRPLERGQERGGSSSDRPRTDRHKERTYPERRPLSPPTPERRQRSPPGYEPGRRRAPAPESGGRRRQHRSPPPPESRRRRSREEPSPDQQYHDEELSDQPGEGEVPREELYLESDDREEELPHMSERGRGRGVPRPMGGGYRGRGTRGGPMIRGVRLPFRGAPYPRGGYPPPRRGYPPPRGFFFPVFRPRLPPPFLPMHPFMPY